MGQNGWPNFKSVFFVSSVTGDGIDALRQYLKELSTPLEWHYNKDTITTKVSYFLLYCTNIFFYFKEPKAICLENIRSKFLDILPAYISYGLKLHICEWEHLEPNVFLKNMKPVLQVIFLLYF